MRSDLIYAKRTAELLRSMGGWGCKLVYAVTAALYYVILRKKTERGIDKLVISCYNDKNERMFLLETKVPRNETAKESERETE